MFFYDARTLTTEVTTEMTVRKRKDEPAAKCEPLSLYDLLDAIFSKAVVLETEIQNDLSVTSIVNIRRLAEAGKALLGYPSDEEVLITDRLTIRSVFDEIETARNSLARLEGDQRLIREIGNLVTTAQALIAPKAETGCRK